MALINIRYKSSALGRETGINVILNTTLDGPYNTFYLLHGLSDNENNWTRFTALEIYAQKYPMLIVMPEGGRGWYADSPIGNYESYITNELIKFIEKTFPVRKGRNYRSIGGLSMGGYGALKFGFKYPNKFCAVGSHSSAVNFSHNSDEMFKPIPEFETIENAIKAEKHDLYQLAEKCPKKKRPAIYFDCGKSDFLFEENEKFHAHLKKLKVSHTYKRFDGAHSWPYWNEHIQDSLRFVNRVTKNNIKTK
jgi:S-formylglutathione hydrolase FrmB